MSIEYRVRLQCAGKPPYLRNMGKMTCRESIYYLLNEAFGENYFDLYETPDEIVTGSILGFIANRHYNTAVALLHSLKGFFAEHEIEYALVSRVDLETSDDNFVVHFTAPARSWALIATCVPLIPRFVYNRSIFAKNTFEEALLISTNESTSTEALGTWLAQLTYEAYLLIREGKFVFNGMDAIKYNGIVNYMRDASITYANMSYNRDLCNIRTCTCAVCTAYRELVFCPGCGEWRTECECSAVA